MSDIAPCPHCGAAAELREWEWPYVRFQVRCSAKCTGGRKADKADAIAVWNARFRDPDNATDRIARRIGAKFTPHKRATTSGES